MIETNSMSESRAKIIEMAAAIHPLEPIESIVGNVRAIVSHVFQERHNGESVCMRTVELIAAHHPFMAPPDIVARAIEIETALLGGR